MGGEHFFGAGGGEHFFTAVGGEHFFTAVGGEHFFTAGGEHFFTGLAGGLGQGLFVGEGVLFRTREGSIRAPAWEESMGHCEGKEGWQESLRSTVCGMYCASKSLASVE